MTAVREALRALEKQGEDRIWRTAKAAGEEMDRMRAALEICASDYISEPCNILQSVVLLGEEFQRRMDTAFEALEEIQ